MKFFTYTFIIIAGLHFCLNTNLYAQQNLSCVGQQGSATWHVYDDIPDNSLEDMYVDPSYPSSPAYEIPIIGLETVSNFNNDYGTVVRGFIKVPETGEYVFNVTGNNFARFFMSNGTNVNNLSMVATTVGSTGKTSHYVNPAQTSAVMNLIGDRYHYFELHHKEGMYSDHATVYWQTPSQTDTLWRVVNASALYSYTCFDACPTEGTACDDGDPNTTNDVEDGNCNCVGEYTTSNSCVGNRGDVLAMFYMDIPFSNIDELYNSPKYPLLPDTAIEVQQLNMPYNFADDYGTLVKGYLRVPETGNYNFNLTGDDDCRFYISDGSNVNNIAMVAEVDGWTSRTQHYKYASQTSGNINLNKSKFYYFEIHQKEGGGGDHSNVYWKTPFRADTNWTIVQSMFLYGYDCEDACVPQGTACNDHDPNTENDQYDANCDCVGTPCTSGPCGNGGNNHVATDFCAPSNRYANGTMDSWLSCQKTANPNPTNANSHWIMYDFGEILKIEGNHYWNYNVKNNMGKGFKDVKVEYSENASDWTDLGTIIWPKAPGTNNYVGDTMAQLNGVMARYVLLTAISTWNSSSNCAGFSEIKFDIRRCRTGGTLCDDGDPLTIGDIYDNDCNCIGIPVDVENPCDDLILTIEENSVMTGDYNAEDKVVSLNSNVRKGNIVTYTGGNTVELNGGFEVKKGALFYASIAPCVEPLAPRPPTLLKSVKYEEKKSEGVKREEMSVNAFSPTVSEVSFNVGKKGPVSLRVEDSDGNLIQQIQKDRIMKSGDYSKQIPTGSWTPDIYHVILQTKNNVLRQRIVVTGDEVTVR